MDEWDGVNAGPRGGRAPRRAVLEEEPVFSQNLDFARFEGRYTRKQRKNGFIFSLNGEPADLREALADREVHSSVAGPGMRLLLCFCFCFCFGVSCRSK